jgi:hypothetical protein
MESLVDVSRQPACNSYTYHCRTGKMTEEGPLQAMRGALRPELETLM